MEEEAARVAVVLDRDTATGLGIVLVSEPSGVGDLELHRVGALIPESPAALAGVVHVGDNILSANGVQLHGATHDEALFAFALATSVALELERNNAPLQEAPAVPQPMEKKLAMTRSSSLRAPPAYVTMQRKEVEVRRDGFGTFGVTLVTLSGLPGVYIGGILTGGVAAHTELAVYDHILAVDGCDCRDLLHEEVVALLRAAGRVVTLSVAAEAQRVAAMSPQRKQQTFVTLFRVPGRPLGLAVYSPPSGVGVRVAAAGTDKNTPAGITRELQRGDLLVACNGMSLRHSSHEEAMAALSLQNELTLVLESVSQEDENLMRSPPIAPRTLDFDFSDSPEKGLLQAQAMLQAPSVTSRERRTVKLVKTAGQGLGLRVTTELTATCTRIAEVIPGGAAEAAGNVYVGDRIIAVNGMSLEHSSHDEAVAALKLSHDVILMLEQDDRPLPAQAQVLASTAASTRALEEQEQKQSQTPMKKKDSKKNRKNSQSSLKAEGKAGMSLQRHITLQRQLNKPIGIKILTYPSGLGARISDISPEGLAAQENLKMGDRLITINRIDVQEASHERILQALRQPIDGSILLVVEDDMTPIDRGAAEPTPSAVIQGDPSLLCNQKDISITRKAGRLGFRFYSLLDGPFVRISDIVPGSAAADTALRTDQIIVAVDGRDVLNAGHEAVLRALQLGQETVVVRVADLAGIEPEPSLPSPSIYAGPKKTSNLVRTPGTSLGLKLKSWRDAVGVRIVYVAPESPAAATAIAVGDMIVSINGRQVLDLQHAEVVEALVSAPLLELVTAVPLDKMVSLELSGGASYGLALFVGQDGLPTVLECVPGSPAAESRQIHRGDQLLAVNGHVLHDVGEQQVRAYLQAPTVELQFRTPANPITGPPTSPPTSP